MTKVTFVGNVIDVTCVLETGEIISAEISGNRKDVLTVGDQVRIGWDSADLGVFPG